MVALGWVSCILGFVLRKLAGLEAMFVLQFSWLIVMWLNETLHPPFESLGILKYTSGYNHNFTITNHTSTNIAPYTYQFKTDSLLFSNNYNISLGLVILCWVACIVNYYRLKNVENLRYSDNIEEKNTNVD